MKAHKKIMSWVSDYGYMVRGATTSIFYNKPPKHYLEYTVKGKVSVILVPGILGKWGFMKNLGDKISLAGHPVYIVPELGYNVYSIPSSAKMLRSVVSHIFSNKGHTTPDVSRGAKSVKNIIEKHKLEGVVLVAHSKGGLIGKYLLAHQNSDNKVLGMVSIATPFSGSAMAKLLPLDPIRELLKDSKVLIDLEKHNEVNHKIISIYPEYDNHVWSENGSRLDGAHNIEVPVRGHHRVIFDKKVQDIVLKSIEKITLD